MLGAKLSVVWDWGAWDELFAPMDDATVLTDRSQAPKLPVHTTRLSKDGGDTWNQQLDFDSDTVVLETGHIFSVRGLPPIAQPDIAGWLPKPSAALDERADRLRAEMPPQTVGVHVRRTDHKASIQESPDELFDRAITELVGNGRPVFLATDNRETRARYERLFPGSILTLNPRRDLEKRWPVRERIACDVEDDFLDLLVLSRCEWVIGSWFSSFSGLAIAMNRDPRCVFMKRESVKNS